MLRKALDSKALSARQGRGRRTGSPPPAKGPAWRAEAGGCGPEGESSAAQLKKAPPTGGAFLCSEKHWIRRP